MKNTGVIATEKSGNSKLGIMSATYASQRTCPASCKFLNSGCYAERNLTGIHTRRINREASHLDPITLAINEANAIDTLTGKYQLRIHVVGDATTDKCAQIVSSAAKRYSAKHGRGAHSYTHAWRNVARSSWQDVSVLASCETFAEAKQALERGYAPAIVLPEKHKSKKCYKVDDLTIIPCPQQTKASANCLTCKLCFNDKALYARRAVIAFQPDRNTEQSVRQTLIQIGGKK